MWSSRSERGYSRRSYSRSSSYGGRGGGRGRKRRRDDDDNGPAAPLPAERCHRDQRDALETALVEVGSRLPLVLPVLSTTIINAVRDWMWIQHDQRESSVRAPSRAATWDALRHNSDFVAVLMQRDPFVKVARDAIWHVVQRTRNFPIILDTYIIVMTAYKPLLIKSQRSLSRTHFLMLPSERRFRLSPTQDVLTAPFPFALSELAFLAAADLWRGVDEAPLGAWTQPARRR